MFKFHKNIKNSLKTTTELSIFRSIIALGFAGIDTIWALYMSSFNLSESTIGFISAGLIIISLLFSFYSTIILEMFNEFKILIFSLIIFIISYFSIVLFDNLYFFVGISIILTILGILKTDSFDILFRDLANDETLSEEEGLLYTLINISWFLGQLIAGLILSNYGIKYVFISSAIFILIGILFVKKLNISFKKKRKRKNR
jgi:MFS family permease